MFASIPAKTVFIIISQTQAVCFILAKVLFYIWLVFPIVQFIKILFPGTSKYSVGQREFKSNFQKCVFFVKLKKIPQHQRLRRGKKFVTFCF